MQTLLYSIFFFITLSTCGQNKKQNSNQKIEQKTMKNTNQENQNPENIIKLLMDAMQTNDAEKIRSLFDDNASQTYGEGTPKSGKAFFSWLDSDIIERKGKVEKPKFTVNNNEVVVTGQYSSVGYTNKANFLFSVKEGKIMSWQMRY